MVQFCSPNNTSPGIVFYRRIGILIVFLLLTGCTFRPSTFEPGNDLVFDFNSIQTQGSERTQLELSVLDALNDGIPKGVRYDASINRIVVTVFASGMKFSRALLEEYRKIAEEVSHGIPVVIEVDPGEAPSY